MTFHRMNKHMIHLFNSYRKSINPPYKPKDYFVLVATFLVLLAIPTTIVLLQSQTNAANYAQTLSVSESVLPTEVPQFVVNGRILTPPKKALQAIGMPTKPGEKHGLGAKVIFSKATSSGLAQPTTTNTSSTSLAAGTIPVSVDLSQYAPPVGNQGSVNSCMAWAEDYYQRDWYASRDGYAPSATLVSFAPMYTYSQVPGGSTNSPTYMNDHYNIMQTQGVDTRADYTQGDYNYSSLPTASEKLNATNYKIASYSSPYWCSDLNCVNPPMGGIAVQNTIQNAMAAGNPVVLLFQVYSNFYYAGMTVGTQTYSDFVDYPGTGTLYGNHGVIALKYDTNGVWIENQWGTGWGSNGWAELSWNYVNNYVFQVGSIVPITPSITPTPTPTITSTATPTLTPTPTPILPTLPSGQTPTPTVLPTSTPIPTPTPLPTATLTPTPSIKDTIAPTVSITYPGNNTTIQRNSQYTIQATASDNIGVTKVEFYVNGTLTCVDTTVPTSSCAWSVTGKPNATYSLQAKAYDTAGNVGTSSIVTVKTSK